MKPRSDDPVLIYLSHRAGDIIPQAIANLVDEAIIQFPRYSTRELTDAIVDALPDNLSAIREGVQQKKSIMSRVGS